jgi:hypothetical protein
VLRYVVLVEHAAEAATPEEAAAIVTARLAPCEVGEPPAADGSDGDRDRLPGWYIRAVRREERSGPVWRPAAT